MEKLFIKKDELKVKLAEAEDISSDTDKLTDEIETITDKIANLVGEKNKEMTNEYLSNMKDPLDGFNQIETWKLKKRLAPKNSIEPPMAKKDSHGNLISDKSQLEKLYLDTYVDRLTPNKMAAGLEQLEEMKNYLFQLRYDLCSERVTKDWTMSNLENVFKSLKGNKARDAHGHTYEIFKFGGKDLKKSLLDLCNLVKKKQIYPSIFQPANITSLYKKRGEKSDFDNDRGIFNVVKLRSILDRLIYNDKYSVIDSKMSCSNIGARRGRNIRDHLFVLNAVMHEVSSDKNKNIDLEIYDVKKCFDKMWAAETANDAFKAGLDDDQFVLVANSNKSCQVAVKTPWGSLTQRKTLNDIEMQGGVLTPLKCSVQMDTLGKEIMENTNCGKMMYKYKDCVSIPVLTFIDDAISVTDCGPNSVKVNACVQSKVDTKRLELGVKKCFKMHIGNDKSACPTLKVHNTEMSSSNSEKYLGDVITSNAKIEENLKMRHDKGIGISNDILSILKEVSFGVYHFQMGLLFRTSQLLNGILFNTEALFSISEKQIIYLEDCDKYLLRSMFKAEMGTPVESLFIETATIPLRFVLQGRRIMYYWTILKKEETELVKRVFIAMKEFRTKGDWLTQVENDLQSCDIQLMEEEIKAMSRNKFKTLVKKKIRERSMLYLTELQAKHSKSQYLHQGQQMQEYLSTDRLTIREKQLLFKLRSAVTPNKANFRKKYEDDLSCILCGDISSVETLHHFLTCSYLTSQPQLGSELKTIKYEDIYGKLSDQIRAVKVWNQVFKIYEKKKDE